MPFLKRAANIALAILLITSPAVAQSIPLSGISPPDISHAPTGNAHVGTVSSAVEQTTTASQDSREFLLSLGLSSATGDGGKPDNDKVTLYSGFVAKQGSADGWAANHLASARPGFFVGGKDKHILRTDECDLDNLDVDVPALLRGVPTQFPQGVERPFSACLYISGQPTGSPNAHRNTYGALITSGVWQFGYAVMTNDLSQAGFYEATNAIYGLDVEGTHSIAARFNGGPISAQFRHGPDQNVLIRGPVDLKNGSSISCVNDKNDAFTPCEILSAKTVFNAPVVLKNYKVAELPDCNEGTKFAMVAVNDLALPPNPYFPIYGARLDAKAGGGKAAWPAFCDGANWTLH